MKKLLFVWLSVFALSAMGQMSEPTPEFVKTHVYYLSKASEKSMGFPDVSSYFTQWESWTDENVQKVDLTVLYPHLLPQRQYQHFRIGNSPYVLTVQTQSYVQNLYNRSLIKQRKK